MDFPSRKLKKTMKQPVFSRVRQLLSFRFVICAVLTDWLLLSPHCTADHFDAEGPHFLSEPSRLNYFTSVQGLLLHCSARGSPTPRIHWIRQKDNQPVELVPGIRELYPNGTMYFPPFAVSYYRPDIHDQVYVCIATNSVGKVRSRDVHVRAVINQQFDVRVESAYTSEGNDALLRCIVPDPVKDFVSITSWMKDSTLNIFPPHSGGGGRYFMAPSGELLIEDVSRNDSTSMFRCRTVNRLTDQTQLSENSARLQLKGGPVQITPPRIVSRMPRIRLKEGDVGVIFCLSEGHPPPRNGWLKVLSYGGMEPLRPSERVRIRQSVVIFETVVAQDAGTYICMANNSAGSDQYKLEVVISKALEVQVVPSLLTVDIGKTAEFSCWTNRASDASLSSSSSATAISSSSPQSTSGGTITWRKDGMEIRPTLRTSFSTSGDKLRIATVQREDKGIYQCFVKTDLDMCQAAAELRLGDSHPQLLYRFIEQTLRPGAAVSIKCSAAGNPTPHITWLLDGFPLPHSERLLIGQYVTMSGDVVSHVNITTTRVEDGGEFQCTATNKLGSAQHSARLNIYGSPFVRNMPSTLTAVAGKSFYIKCPVAGYPITSITWEKDEQLLPSTIRQTVSQNGTLTIRDIDRAVDSGWYTCTATNKQGSSNKRGVHINVVVPPKLSPFSFPISPREGERILAMCGVSDGDPPVRLQWLKDSFPIYGTGNSTFSHNAVISTHQMSEFGVLALQIPHVTANDTGNYSCVAQNAAGHASYTLPLIVHVPPRIAPYSFPSPVSQGSRVQVVCSVEQGDIEETNLTVTWLKDMDPIGQGGGGSANAISSTTTNAKVMRVDAYSTILIIERVDWERDSGNYTCRISNSVDEVHKTNELVVRVPPKWVEEPKDNDVVEGKAFRMRCQARGFPTPKISWKRAMSDRPENFQDVPLKMMSSLSSAVVSPSSPFVSGYHSQQQEVIQRDVGVGQSSSVTMTEPFAFSNGTLYIPLVTKTHHGFYLCDASNGIGSGLSKVIRLIVNVPTRIKEPTQNVSSPVGGKAVLQCEISGDPPLLTAGWRKGLEEIKPDLFDPFRYSIRLLNSTGRSGSGAGNPAGKSVTTLSELTVANVKREDSARYVCFAGNRHGESQGAMWLYVQEPPDVPRNLHVLAKSSRFVRLGWILTQTGNSPLTQFLIQYKPVDRHGESQLVRVAGTVFSETIRNLHPATTYVFTVKAQNQVGESEQSEGFQVKTDGEAPEGIAQNVRVTPVSSTDIQVTWEHPDRDTWHGQLLGYYVGFRKYRSEKQYQFSTVERKDASFQEFLITNLAAYTQYEIIVQAYNGIGTGPMSDVALVSTLEAAPNGFPDGIHCNPLTPDTLQLAWNPVTGESARGVITGYKVSLEKVDEDNLEEAQPLSRTTGTTSFVFNSLSKYSNYSVQVEAYTSVGSGPLSPPIYCQTEEDVPNAPGAIKAVVSSSSSITVSWLPPIQRNGQLTKYTLYISPVTEGSASRRDNASTRKRTLSPDTNKFQFEGLKVDEKYEFRVAASTRIGEGEYLSVQKTQTKSVVSSIISFGQDWKVVWKTDVRLACEIVGSSIIQWTKFTQVVQENDRIAMNSDGSVLIRDLKREDSGNYTCTINANGHGIDSIVHRVRVQVPPAAPLMTASGTSYSTVNLQWKLSDSGGAPTKGYVLHVKASEEWIEKKLSRYLNTYELPGLECGTYYQMYLTAYNRAGMGRASELVNVSTLGSAPTLKLISPEFMVQSNRSVSRVLLKDVWSGNGCKIKAFRVFYKPSESTHWQTVGGNEIDGESHSVDLVGLKASSKVQIRVIAMNSAGSQTAEIVVTTPVAIMQSNAPGSESATNHNMNHLQATPFYMDVKLIGLLFLSVIAFLFVSISACVCYKRKSASDGASNAHLSVGSPSSSLYFKHNPNHQMFHANPPLPHHPAPPLRSGQQQQQLYMTVKKSTPMKGGIAEIETIPQYADDIYPYATFEVNEPPQIDSRACNTLGATLDRTKRPIPPRRKSDSQESIRNIHSLQQSHHRRNTGEDSDEYESYGSDSEYQDEQLPMKHHMTNKTRRISSGGGGKGTAGMRQAHPKCQDYDSHTRCGNRYEMGPSPGKQQSDCSSSIVVGKYQPRHLQSVSGYDDRRGSGGGVRGDSKSSGVIRSLSQNDDIIHGLVSSEPYAFNDSYPTALIQDKRGTGKKKNGRRKFHITNLEPYVSSTELIPEKIMLDPPEGFTDSLSNRKSNGKEEEIEEDSESCSTSASSGRDGVKGFGKSSQREGKLQAAKSNSNEYTISV